MKLLQKLGFWLLRLELNSVMQEDVDGKVQAILFYDDVDGKNLDVIVETARILKKES